MDSEKVKALLIQAVEIATLQGRADFLQEVGLDDPEIKAELESLLQAHEAAGDFLSSPAPELGRTLDRISLSEGPGTVIGPYKLLEKIGEGGMAVVYMAEQKHPLKRRVALKIIKLGMDTGEVIARFEVERQALAMMDHPNIAKVFDAGATETGRPYFVMELVRGMSLTAYCDKNNLDTRGRLALYLPVCNAVHHAHQKGIIHRDLKPSNVMVTTRDGEPMPKIIDFGISKATNQQLTDRTVFTRYAQMIGTPEYMSPEQAEMGGLDIDTRTDIYSLGVVLYELLTGILPFDGETLRTAGYAEIQRIIRDEEPLRPSTRISTLGKAAEDIAARRSTNVAGLTKRLHSELEWIPMKALRKDRTRRYASASEFAQDIHNYLNDQPLMAGPESALYRLGKMVHKYRALVMTVSVIAVVSIAGLVSSAWLYVGRSQARGIISELEHQAFQQETLATVQRLHGEGCYQEALDEIRAKFDERDLPPQVQVLRALLLIELGEFAQARANLNLLIQADPEIASAAHCLLARLNLFVDLDKVDHHLELAEAMRPETAEAYYLRAMIAASPDKALTWLSEALRIDRGHYEALKARTLAYSSLELYPQMAGDAGVLIFMHPDDYIGHALKAVAHRETGQFDLALEEHAQAIELCTLDDELPGLYDQRRRTYMKHGNYRAALADAQQYAVLRHDDVYRHFSIFTALVALEEYEKAKAIHKGVYKQGARVVGHFQGTVERYVFDLLRTGQPFTLAPNIAAQSPFYLMQQFAELYTLLKKKQARSLAVSEGFWLGGDWSSDGKHLVYQRIRAFSWLPSTMEGAKPDSATSFIETMELATGKTRQISRFGGNPLWSPDGNNIAFTERYGDYAEKTDVWVVSAAGGQPRKLAAGVAAKWSQDSKHLYFRASATRTICSIAIDVPEAQPLPVFESPGMKLSLCAISPDESLIAIQSPFEIHVLTFPGGQEVAHWKLPWPLVRWVTQLQWHPNGKTLILNSRYNDNQMGMCLFNIERAEAIHAFNLTRPWCRTLWSPDGSRLIIETSGAGPWIMDVDPKRPLEEALAPTLTTSEFLAMLRQRWDHRITLDPLDAEHYVSRAVVLMAAKDFEQVRQDLTQCIALINEPNDPACYALKHWAQMHRSQRSTESEIWRLYYTQLVEKLPDHFAEIQ